MLNKIIDGIENLIRWFPVIWQDRDWDFWFLYKILRFKLVRMERYFRKYGMAVSSEKEAKNIKRCILVLDRLIEDDYDLSAFKEHDRKWGETIMDLSSSDSSLNMHRPNVMTEKDKEQESKEFRRCIDHEEHTKRQDIEYLFDLMKKHVQCWWD